MINSVPVAIQNAARTVTLNHPNSLECVIYRKVFTRTAPNDETMGGAPTMGGLGVLSPEDEEAFTYEPLGDARMLLTSRYDGPLDTTDRGDSIVPDAVLQEALIEPVDVPGFASKKYDLVAAMPGGGVVIAFEIVAIPTGVNIYPYTKKYVVAPRDELHDLQPWSGED